MRLQRPLRYAILAALAAGCVTGGGRMSKSDEEDGLRTLERQAVSILDYVEGDAALLRIYDVPWQTQPAPVAQVLNTLRPIVPVYAQTEDGVDLIRNVVRSMRERNEALAALKAQGLVGENNRGYAELYADAAIDDPEVKNEAQRIVAAERNDRKALYKELVQRYSAFDYTVTTVEAIFAEMRLKRGAFGEVFQLPQSEVSLDRFAASPAGQRADGVFEPGAWIVLR